MLIYPGCTVTLAGVDALWQDGTWSAESKYDGTLLRGFSGSSEYPEEFKFWKRLQFRTTVNFQFQQPWIAVASESNIRCALYIETSYPAACLLSRYASPQQLKGAHTAKSDDVWCARCSSKSFVLPFWWRQASLSNFLDLPMKWKCPSSQQTCAPYLASKSGPFLTPRRVYCVYIIIIYYIYIYLII